MRWVLLHMNAKPIWLNLDRAAVIQGLSDGKTCITLAHGDHLARWTVDEAPEVILGKVGATT